MSSPKEAIKPLIVCSIASVCIIQTASMIYNDFKVKQLQDRCIMEKVSAGIERKNIIRIEKTCGVKP